MQAMIIYMQTSCGQAKHLQRHHHRLQQATAMHTVTAIGSTISSTSHSLHADSLPPPAPGATWKHKHQLLVGTSSMHDQMYHAQTESGPTGLVTHPLPRQRTPA